ncbi:MAG TPA: hypothetical protein VHA33_21795 [Candidatus Angelobacter sp.]|jgi:hypothetical protein|nr:hypothetical protein [Candidatus Angelobacter sp.]
MLHNNEVGAIQFTDPAHGHQEAGIPHPELAGRKARIPGTTPIYLIDRKGYRRYVSCSSTFVNLFGGAIPVNSMMVAEEVGDIAIGPPLDERAILVRGASLESVYLLDKGTKKLISSSQVMNKYGFDEKCIISVPQVLIDSVPVGEVWE